MKINIIGAGLAGSEAAWYLAKKGYQIDLYEQRPKTTTPAHQTQNFAELVCSNSLRSNEVTVGAGLLKHEMKELGSIIVEAANATRVPAGSALAVDREGFSKYVTEALSDLENINIIHEEYVQIDTTPTIICSGPLTSDSLKKSLEDHLGDEYFYFFDAAAPIIEMDSINMDIAYLKSRYDKGDADYINCPMTEEEFDRFYEAVITAECVEQKDFELKVFEGCMPFEVMAKRGRQTLTFGPMKPVGLRRPDGTTPFAVVQLRQDNAAKSLYNIVGFQTHLKFGEQKKVIQMIPGLEKANIVRYGVMHRNTFINSPKLLNSTYQTKQTPSLFIAGQITGVEGYVESAASGINAAINMDKYLQNKPMIDFPRETAFGALSYYITHSDSKNFQPMNINFGIIKDLEFKVKKKERKQAYADRAIAIMTEFIKENIDPIR